MEGPRHSRESSFGSEDLPLPLHSSSKAELHLEQPVAAPEPTADSSHLMPFPWDLPRTPASAQGSARASSDKPQSAPAAATSSSPSCLAKSSEPKPDAGKSPQPHSAAAGPAALSRAPVQKLDSAALEAEPSTPLGPEDAEEAELKLPGLPGRQLLLSPSELSSEASESSQLGGGDSALEVREMETSEPAADLAGTRGAGKPEGGTSLGGGALAATPQSELDPYNSVLLSAAFTSTMRKAGKKLQKPGVQPRLYNIPAKYLPAAHHGVTKPASHHGVTKRHANAPPPPQQRPQSATMTQRVPSRTQKRPLSATLPAGQKRKQPQQSTVPRSNFHLSLPALVSQRPGSARPGSARPTLTHPRSARSRPKTAVEAKANASIRILAAAAAESAARPAWNSPAGPKPGDPQKGDEKPQKPPSRSSSVPRDGFTPRSRLGSQASESGLDGPPKIAIEAKFNAPISVLAAAATAEHGRPAWGAPSSPRPGDPQPDQPPRPASRTTSVTQEGFTPRSRLGSQHSESTLEGPPKIALEAKFGAPISVLAAAASEEAEHSRPPWNAHPGPKPGDPPRDGQPKLSSSRTTSIAEEGGFHPRSPLGSQDREAQARRGLLAPTQSWREKEFAGRATAEEVAAAEASKPVAWQPVMNTFPTPVGTLPEELPVIPEKTRPPSRQQSSVSRQLSSVFRQLSGASHLMQQKSISRGSSLSKTGGREAAHLAGQAGPGLGTTIRPKTTKEKEVFQKQASNLAQLMSQGSRDIFDAYTRDLDKLQAISAELATLQASLRSHASIDADTDYNLGTESSGPSRSSHQPQHHQAAQQHGAAVSHGYDDSHQHPQHHGTHHADNRSTADSLASTTALVNEQHYGGLRSPGPVDSRDGARDSNAPWTIRSGTGGGQGHDFSGLPGMTPGGQNYISSGMAGGAANGPAAGQYGGAGAPNQAYGTHVGAAPAGERGVLEHRTSRGRILLVGSEQVEVEIAGKSSSHTVAEKAAIKSALLQGEDGTIAGAAKQPKKSALSVAGGPSGIGRRSAPKTEMRKKANPGCLACFCMG